MNNTSDNKDKALTDNICRQLSHLIIGFGVVTVLLISICIFSISGDGNKSVSSLDQGASSIQQANTQVSIDYNQLSKKIADEITAQIGISDNIFASKFNERMTDISSSPNIDVPNITTNQADEIINQLSMKIPDVITSSISDYVSETSKQTADNAKAAFALAKSTSDINLANLYYLNAINSDPCNIEILSSYKDFIIDNQLDDLIGSFIGILYNIGQIADYSILPEIFSISNELAKYQNEISSISQYTEFVLSDISKACDNFESMFISGSSFSALTAVYLDILDMQDNCIETLDANTENRLIMVDQLYSFTSAYNTAENIYSDLSGLTGEDYINQYPTLISSLQSCYDLFDVDISIYNDTTREIIGEKRDTLNGFFESAEEMYHQEFRNVINQIVDDSIIKSRSLKSNADKIETLTNANYTCSVLLSASLNTSDYDSISSAIQKLNQEILDINRNRLVAYQTWAYETMMGAENMIENFSKKTIANDKILSIQQTGLLSIDRNLLSYQLQAVYDETLSMIHDKVLKDESSEKFYYSKLAETPIKQLEDF